MTTEEAIVGKLRTLPVEKQQRVLDFVEHLHAEETPSPPRRSPNRGPISAPSRASPAAVPTEQAVPRALHQRLIVGYP